MRLSAGAPIEDEGDCPSVRAPSPTPHRAPNADGGTVPFVSRVMRAVTPLLCSPRAPTTEPPRDHRARTERQPLSSANGAHRVARNSLRGWSACRARSGSAALVDRVLIHVEPAAPHRPVTDLERRPVGGPALRKLGHLVGGRPAFGVVVQEHDPVAFHHAPAAEPRLRRDALRGGNFDAAPLAVPEPAVEGAADRVALKSRA